MTRPLRHRGWVLRVCLRGASATLALAATLVPNQSAQAQTFTILHSFTGAVGDGAYPYAGLSRDSAGNLYGTTTWGGSLNLGTIFKVDATGTETVLYSFTGTGGYGPAARLVRDVEGNIYGTAGGEAPTTGEIVFKIKKPGVYTVLYTFFGGADGAYPEAGVILDTAGNVYGTSAWGGTFGLGTVFKVDALGNETVLHSFEGWDGEYPAAGLVRDDDGNLYGTASEGGNYFYGVVFKLETNGTETVLHSFPQGSTDGVILVAGLVRDAAGNFYGTTIEGGAHSYGTAVFKLDTSGTETMLHDFKGGIIDGQQPLLGSLLKDGAGNLYGTTRYGGSGSCVTSGNRGCGVVFKLTP